MTAYESDGYVRVPGFLSTDECAALLEAGHALLCDDHHDDVIVRFEDNLPDDLPPEQRVSKLYRLHRREPFRALCTSPRLLDHVRPPIDGDIDVFLSQLVWKVPGALGQPWHQDASIFPFEPARPVVGVWLALTNAREENGCLLVVPGSHRQLILEHGADHRSPTRGRYLSLVDQCVDGGVALPVEAGDLVVFDSHLLHTSTDNVTNTPRVALTFHFASAGTVDRTAERFGRSPYNDWMPAFRKSSGPR